MPGSPRCWCARCSPSATNGCCATAATSSPYRTMPTCGRCSSIASGIRPARWRCSARRASNSASTRNCFRTNSAGARSRCSRSTASIRWRRCRRSPTTRRSSASHRRHRCARHAAPALGHATELPRPLPRRWTLARRIHRTLVTALQEQLVFVRSPFSRSTSSSAGSPASRHAVQRSRVVRADRVGFIDYQLTDCRGDHAPAGSPISRPYYREEPPTHAEYLAARPVRACRRGSPDRSARRARRVFPRAGDRRDLDIDEARLSARPLLGRLCARSPATMIEFRDVPEMTRISSCPTPRTSTAPTCLASPSRSRMC